MADNKIQMPSGMGGLVRYFDGGKSKLQLTPEHVTGLILLVIIVEVVLNII